MSETEIPLPDTSLWQPRKTATETLKSAFLKRCLAIENQIRARVNIEREMNIDNFDAGSAIEDIIREELTKLLPSRYSVKGGVINDRHGNTAGDSDIVIHNEIWFPTIKGGATQESRRIHFPIESVYAVGEVKQTMDFKVLDDAMEKLVICHRLHRPSTYAYRVTENREGSPCSHGLTNPLYSFIIATNVKSGVELDKLVDRFFFINQTLGRHEVVRSLCILGYGTVSWGYKDEVGKESKPALFMLEDLYKPLVPLYHKIPDIESAFYALIVDLMLHLYQSVLAPEDIAPSYGSLKNRVKVPKAPDIALEPDPERLASLTHFCKAEHTSIPIIASPAQEKTRKKRRRR